MIEFDCPHCGTSLRVPNSAAGRTGKCRVCGKPISVPVSNVELDPIEDEWPDLTDEEPPPVLPRRKSAEELSKPPGDLNMERQKTIASRKKKAKSGGAKDERKTDIFAILAFTTGIVSILVLPIIFAPACYICAIISYYRLKENPDELKGKGLRIVGAICGLISMLWLIYVFKHS